MHLPNVKDVLELSLYVDVVVYLKNVVYFSNYVAKYWTLYCISGTIIPNCISSVGVLMMILESAVKHICLKSHMFSIALRSGDCEVHTK